MQSSFRAGEGSVTQVEVFQMAGLGTAISDTSTPIPRTDARPTTPSTAKSRFAGERCPAPTRHRYCLATRASVPGPHQLLCPDAPVRSEARFPPMRGKHQRSETPGAPIGQLLRNRGHEIGVGSRPLAAPATRA
jgi:hypothetical protein